MVEESEVIQGVLRGDAEAFRLLVERYAGPVTRMIRNVTGDGHACEDLAQEVFLAAFAKLRTFDPGRSRFSTWLFTIARNKAVNAAQRRKPTSLAEAPEPCDVNSPESAAAAGELMAALDEALLALPVHQRTAFVLAEFEQLPYETIAQIEGVRIGTVKSRINRAKNGLRQALHRFEVDVS